MNITTINRDSHVLSPAIFHPPIADRVYIDRLIDELDNNLCHYTGKCRKLALSMKIRNEIYKNEDYLAYFLEKARHSVALCLQIVEQAWTNIHQPVSHGNITPEYRMSDYRRESLCELAIRMLLKAADEAIKSRPPAQVNISDGGVKTDAAKNIHIQCEDMISTVSYLLGLTTDKKQGAKQRYGSDPITQVLFQSLYNKNLYYQYDEKSNAVLEGVIKTLSGSYYQFYSEQERLPGEQVVSRIIKEIQHSITHHQKFTETTVYRIVSKAFIDPIIMDLNYEKYQHNCHSNALARTYLNKAPRIGDHRKYHHYLTANLSHQHYFNRLFSIGKTFDISKSRLYQEVEKCLLVHNEKLTAEDILLCCKDYYEFAREKYSLKIPSLAEIAFNAQLTQDGYTSAVPTHRRNAVYLAR